MALANHCDPGQSNLAQVYLNCARTIRSVSRYSVAPENPPSNASSALQTKWWNILDQFGQRQVDAECVEHEPVDLVVDLCADLPGWATDRFRFRRVLPEVRQQQPNLPNSSSCSGSDGRDGRLILNLAKGQYLYFLCRQRQEGRCEAPHLNADIVEAAIVDYYECIRFTESSSRR